MINLPPIKDKQLLYRLARLKEEDKDFQDFLRFLDKSRDELTEDVIGQTDYGLKMAYSGAILYNGYLVEQINNARKTYGQIQEHKKNI